LQNEKRTRFKYSLLVEELRTAETDEYRAIIVAFINCLLARCDSVEERSNMRHDLTGVMHDVMVHVTLQLFVVLQLLTISSC